MSPEGSPVDLRSGRVLVPPTALPQPVPSTDPVPGTEDADPLSWAWVIIANASEGNWNRESVLWRAKAREWADTYAGDVVSAKEEAVGMGRALALITRVQPDQTGEWRAAAGVWCRRHDTEAHRVHLYPLTVVPLFTVLAGTVLSPVTDEPYLPG
jgi:hypothetical protein